MKDNDPTDDRNDQNDQLGDRSDQNDRLGDRSDQNDRSDKDPTPGEPPRDGKHFSINGETLEVPKDSPKMVSVLEILKLAKDKGLITDEPDQYILQGDEGRYKPGDNVDLTEDNVFFTIPNKPTPVA